MRDLQARGQAPGKAGALSTCGALLAPTCPAPDAGKGSLSGTPSHRWPSGHVERGLKDQLQEGCAHWAAEGHKM